MTTGVRRKVFDPDLGLVGDVDLAVLDKASGFLLVAELKWFIEPDSFQEESHVLAEMRKGVSQLESAARAFGKETGPVLKTLFPNEDLDPSSVREVLYCLICEGTVKSRDDLRSKPMFVLDYQVTTAVLQSHAELGVKEQFDLILRLHNEMHDDAAKAICYDSIKIAGYLCRTPGRRVSGQSALYPHKIDGGNRHDNAPCFCGSGRRYVRCCKVIESFKEEEVDYD